MVNPHCKPRMLVIRTMILVDVHREFGWLRDVGHDAGIPKGSELVDGRQRGLTGRIYREERFEAAQPE
jgi:hypothetical protein